MSQYSPNSGGGFAPSGSQGSPGQKPAQTIRPVTIAQLRKATQMHSDAEWKLDDKTIGQITLVAEVREHRVQSTHRGFLLDDGTATMSGKLWIDTPPDQQELPFRGASINESHHFRITGNLRSHSGKKYVHVSNMRLVTDMNEIYYHIMETIYVHVALQKGLPSSPIPISSDQSSGTGAQAYTVQSRPAASQKLFSSLADQVAHYLTTHPAEAEGVNVGDIARAIQCNAADLSDVVERMIDEGHVYTTIDDSHIQLAN
ncbi:RPA-C domain-containing protein [Mycena indigotica]|uniref:RPA-C domain-containing protein n=1 Tax=Mycena indigotica TaxID=2126181 RepID=A0A8H6VWW7_9AGAR|nr:RPA-C domain-containing protein [Mycena indigotica]KAF7294871.1 RPA-C domain-containing protein [Mycena indigotica]